MKIQSPSDQAEPRGYALQGHVHYCTSLLLAVVAVGVRAGAVAVVDEAEGGVPYKASGSREAQLGHSGIIFSFNNSFISLHAWSWVLTVWSRVSRHRRAALTVPDRQE